MFNKNIDNNYNFFSKCILVNIKLRFEAQIFSQIMNLRNNIDNYQKRGAFETYFRTHNSRYGFCENYTISLSVRLNSKLDSQPWIRERQRSIWSWGQTFALGTSGRSIEIGEGVSSLKSRGWRGRLIVINNRGVRRPSKTGRQSHFVWMDRNSASFLLNRA